MGREHTIHVTHPKSGDLIAIGPDDEIPGWAKKLVHERHFADGEAAVGDGVPPRAGAGSGKDAWRDYAAANGVQVADDATRDDIIAACEAAGVTVGE
jgi:hypothetical protein